MNSAQMIFSLRNVLRGRSRALFCVLAVAVGIAAVTLLYSLGSCGQKLAMEYLKGFGFSGGLVMPKMGINGYASLDMEDADAIVSSVGDVDRAIAFSTKYGMIRTEQGTDSAVFWGVGEDMEQFIGCELLYGRLFEPSDQFGEESVVILDRTCAGDLFGREDAVGQELTLSLSGVSESFRVVGVISQGMTTLNSLSQGQIPTFLYMPHRCLERLSGSREVAEIAVVFNENANRSDVCDRICRLMELRHQEGIGYSVEDMDAYMAHVAQVLDLIKMLLVGAAAVSLIVSGIGVMNAMLSSVKERRQEIGLCLAVGATPGEIAVGFILEAGILSALGGICGAVIGLLLSFLGSMLLGIQFSFSVSALLIAEAAVILTGMVFGTFPACRASRLIPLDTLRGE